MADTYDVNSLSNRLFNDVNKWLGNRGLNTDDLPGNSLNSTAQAFLFNTLSSAAGTGGITEAEINNFEHLIETKELEDGSNWFGDLNTKASNGKGELSGLSSQITAAVSSNASSIAAPDSSQVSGALSSSTVGYQSDETDAKSAAVGALNSMASAGTVSGVSETGNQVTYVAESQNGGINSGTSVALNFNADGSYRETYSNTGSAQVQIGFTADGSMAFSQTATSYGWQRTEFSNGNTSTEYWVNAGASGAAWYSNSAGTGANVQTIYADESMGGGTNAGVEGIASSIKGGSPNISPAASTSSAASPSVSAAAPSSSSAASPSVSAAAPSSSPAASPSVSAAAPSTSPAASPSVSAAAASASTSVAVSATQSNMIQIISADLASMASAGMISGFSRASQYSNEFDYVITSATANMSSGTKVELVINSDGSYSEFYSNTSGNGEVDGYRADGSNVWREVQTFDKAVLTVGNSTYYGFTGSNALYDWYNDIDGIGSSIAAPINFGAFDNGASVNSGAIPQTLEAQGISPSSLPVLYSSNLPSGLAGSPVYGALTSRPAGVTDTQWAETLNRIDSLIRHGVQPSNIQVFYDPNNSAANGNTPGIGVQYQLTQNTVMAQGFSCTSGKWVEYKFNSDGSYDIIRLGGNYGTNYDYDAHYTSHNKYINAGSNGTYGNA